MIILATPARAAGLSRGALIVVVVVVVVVVVPFRGKRPQSEGNSAMCLPLEIPVRGFIIITIIIITIMITTTTTTTTTITIITICRFLDLR